MKPILTVALFVLIQLSWASKETTQNFVNFWKLVWCDFGGLYGFKAFACPPSYPFKPMITGG